jgi:hypothetical protein
MAIDKIFYNEASSARLGWEPSWFGAKEFDDKLISSIIKWQKKNQLLGDGLVGPMTYRRIWTEREAEISNFTPSLSSLYASINSQCKDSHYIVHNGRHLPIDWDRVILWDQDGGLKSNSGTYTSYAGKADREPTMFVNHWDVCLSSESCARVLNKRGISVHFCVDNDGTIYQLLDTQHKAWHAGIARYEGGNPKGIGVEITNAYYVKYQDWYIKNGFGERPIVKDAVCHGKKMGEFLDFYPIQIDALMALWKAIHKGIGIPLECPVDAAGGPVLGVDGACERGQFHGFVNHYNFTRGKIDCACLDMTSLIKRAKKETE